MSYQEQNRRMWDERVPIHVASEFYDVAAWKSGRCSLQPFEAYAALALAAEASLTARFVCADVFDAPARARAALRRGVYTGIGALIWLHDIRRWASVVRALLNPGGCLYLVECHPLTDVFEARSLTAQNSYFHDPAGTVWDEPGTYADQGAATAANVSVEFRHPISDVLSALLDQGLPLELFHEFDHTPFARWPVHGAPRGRELPVPAGMPPPPSSLAARACPHSRRGGLHPCSRGLHTSLRRNRHRCRTLFRDRRFTDPEDDHGTQRTPLHHGQRRPPTRAADLFRTHGPVRAQVIVHGATAVPRGYYAPFARFLASAGFETLTYDYRGVGGSVAGRARDDAATMSDWLTLALRQRRALRGVNPASVPWPWGTASGPSGRRWPTWKRPGLVTLGAATWGRFSSPAERAASRAAS
ncbi:MAG: hypothetical protein IPH72_28230 [Sandaracinaceae bacterium]|nr:hypothetical protein [Sandaracinaceae bacterium]